MIGEFSETGGTLTVRVNGELFATMASSGAGDLLITGADGQPLSDQDAEALRNIFDITGEAFLWFDEMVMPADAFLAPGV